jgi:hypothetical protein
MGHLPPTPRRYQGTVNENTSIRALCNATSRGTVRCNDIGFVRTVPLLDSRELH